MHQINEQRLESLEIRVNNELQRQLMLAYKEHDIPDCHQRYFYNILRVYESEADQLAREEINQLATNKSVVKTLHQLTLGRERCLKEFQRVKNQNIMDQVQQVSKYLYDLRKLTLNLLEFHRKWRRALNSKFQYHYQWIHKGIDYIQKIHDDCNMIKSHHLSMGKHFNFKDEDIFFMGVIDQANTENVEYYEYLKKHRMTQKYVIQMNELQNYFKELMERIPQFKASFEISSSQHALSPKFPSGRTMPIPAVTALPSYQSKMIYSKDDVQFNLVQYPFDNLEVILHYFYSKSALELNETFKYPFHHLKDLLLYWQEANIFQINDNGLLICSIDNDFKGRRWIVHSINLPSQNWDTRMNSVLQHFIKMLQGFGDPFTSLAVSCTNEEYLKKKLEKFVSIKKITYNQFNVVLFEQKVQATQSKRKYVTPLTLKMLRVYAEQTHTKLVTDQELLTAQLCSNLGKNNLITFEPNIQTLSSQLNKSKLYGQEYMLIHKMEDIFNRYQIAFDSPIKAPVYFQQFNIRLNFRFFSSELHRNNNHPYLRLIAHNADQEPSILELSSGELPGKLYLVSTLDPGIRIFIYETQQVDNIQQTVNHLFEKFDKKAEGKTTLWLPQFKCQGKQLTIQDAVLNAYFQNDTSISISYPRIPSLHSISYTHDLDKLIQTPFLIGIVQSDIDNINKPVFSILINNTNVLKEQEKSVPNPLNYLMTFQPREIDTKINELLQNSTLETQQSFTSDPRNIAQILRYGLEATLLNLQNGYALVHVDQDHIQDKRWVIESVMINNLENLQSLLTKIIEYILSSDPSVSEIQISQTHFEQQGELIANKQVMDAIKKSKFKWRLVDNDAKTKIRKTIYYYKNPNQPKSRQTSIQFRCYYALQQSQERNQVVNQLNYLKTPSVYQFFEDCFQYNVKGNGDNDPFVWEKFKQNNLLPNTEFKIYDSIEDLQQTTSIQLPNFGIKYQMMNTLSLDVQLKLRRSRSTQDNKFIDIPNIEGLQQIYQSDINKMNARVIYIPTVDSQYFIYIIENITDVQEVKENYLNITNYVSQAFPTKYNHTCKSLLVPQFKKNLVIQEQQNYLNIEFALCTEFTIEQVMHIQDNQEQQWKIKQPMIVGVLNTQARTNFERPLIMIVE